MRVMLLSRAVRVLESQPPSLGYVSQVPTALGRPPPGTAARKQARTHDCTHAHTIAHIHASTIARTRAREYARTIARSLALTHAR